MNKNVWFLATSIATTAAVTLPAQAYDAGDVVIRAGAAAVIPNDDSGDVAGFPGNGVEVDDSYGFGISFSYMLTPQIGLELLGAAPFSHDINATGPDLGPLGKIAETKHLPPTLLLNYYIPMSHDTPLQPYVGIGGNYTLFFDEKASSSLEGALGESKVDLEDSVGFAVQVGSDWKLKDNWMLNAALWYVGIDTTATIDYQGDPNDPADDGTTTVDVDINPWVVMIGAAYRF